MGRFDWVGEEIKEMREIEEEINERERRCGEISGERLKGRNNGAMKEIGEHDLGERWGRDQMKKTKKKKKKKRNEGEINETPLIFKKTEQSATALKE